MTLSSVVLLSFTLSLGIGAEAREESVLVEGVPHVRQRPDFCGEACAEMALRRLGSDWDQDAIFAASGVDPAEGRGAWTAELARALKKAGFETGAVWRQVPAGGAEAIREEWRRLHADLRRGVPSIVCMRTGEGAGATEHFRLVLGYDAGRDEVVYHEPAEEDGAERRLPLERFLGLWPLKYAPERWTLVRLRLESRAIGRPPPPGAAARAEQAQRVLRLREELAGRGFSVVLEPPFVVVGDEAAAVVARHARGTVRWAVRLLERDFFDRRPELIDVWLFKDERSYREHALERFGESPSTPYGYYSARHRALVMNIATGGGTLVHEIVHPYVRANFPDCPPWLNEGLGSLFERCTERDGSLHGLVNWRLGGLQRAIRAGRVPRFEALLAMDEHAFYEEDPGTNYAQARYLCYWLQERGLLVRFFRELLASGGADPTGLATLRRVAGLKDMRAFEQDWSRFVLGLEEE